MARLRGLILWILRDLLSDLLQMWIKGEAWKIVCTQPRRISAMSVAERISNERGESVGDTVGYKIRMEGKGGKHSSIMFCTNGVLLRVLVSRGVNMSKTEDTNKSLKDALLDITHIIVDEIHERDRFSDFMLAILRDLLPSYPHLRLILMSATIDSERFSRYFNGCPTIQVPGFTHPVKSFYLEDVLAILKSVDDNHLDSATEENAQLTEEDKTALDESINMALSNDEFESLLELVSSEQASEVYNYQHSLTGVSPLMLFAGRGRVTDVCMLLSFGADCSLRDNEGNTALDWAQSENQLEACKIIKKHMASTTSKSAEEEELLNNYLGSINPEHVDTVLIERLLKKICTDSKDWSSRHGYWLSMLAQLKNPVRRCVDRLSVQRAPTILMMKGVRLRPNWAAIVSVLSACSQLGCSQVQFAVLSCVGSCYALVRGLVLCSRWELLSSWLMFACYLLRGLSALLGSDIYPWARAMLLLPGDSLAKFFDVLARKILS